MKIKTQFYRQSRQDLKNKQFPMRFIPTPKQGKINFLNLIPVKPFTFYGFRGQVKTMSRDEATIELLKTVLYIVGNTGDWLLEPGEFGSFYISSNITYCMIHFIVTGEASI